MRRNNIDAICSWLHIYGNEFPSGPQELMIIESRRLEGKPLIKNWYAKGVMDHDLKWDSHTLLRVIVDCELRHERWFWWMNLRDIFLADPDPDPTLLDKWQRDGGLGARIRLGMFHESLGWIADRVRDKRGPEYQLYVPVVELAKLKEIGTPHNRHEQVRGMFQRYRKKLGKDSKALGATARDTGYTRRQVERITEDMRKQTA